MQYFSISPLVNLVLLAKMELINIKKPLCWLFQSQTPRVKYLPWHTQGRYQHTVWFHIVFKAIFLSTSQCLVLERCAVLYLVSATADILHFFCLERAPWINRGFLFSYGYSPCHRKRRKFCIVLGHFLCRSSNKTLGTLQTWGHLWFRY